MDNHRVHPVVASSMHQGHSMQLAIDTDALQPDLLGAALTRVVPNAAYRQAIAQASPQELPSAQMEGPVLERWARTVAWNKVDLIVALGLGSGVLIDLVGSRSEIPLFVLEPRPEVIATALSQRPLLKNNVVLFENVIELRSVLRQTCRFGDRVMLFAPSWAKSELAEHVPELEQTIREAHQRTLVHNSTERKHGHEWNELILDGLFHITGRVPINRLTGKLSGLPGVLVSAGPSLDKNIDVLKEIQDEVVICALNSSLAALDRKGIQPDLLATVESKDIVSMVASSPSLPNMVFAPGLHTYSKLFDLPFREVMPAVSGSRGSALWLTETLGVNPLGVGGSVACLGFSILLEIGCDPIILLGQDCALKGERMYAQGTPLEEMRWERKGGVTQQRSIEPILRMQNRMDEFKNQEGSKFDTFTVPGWDGGQVWTIPQLNTYRLWFEEQAFELKDTVTLINATEGGAAIKGFESKTLRSIIKRLPREKTDVVAKLLMARDDSHPIDSFVLAKSLRDEVKSCTEAKTLALRGQRSAQRLLKLLGARKIKAKEARREAMRLEKAENALCALTPRAQLLDAYVGVALEDIRRTAVREEADSPEQGTRQSLEHTVAICKEIASTATELAARLEDVALRLEKQGRN